MLDKLLFSFVLNISVALDYLIMYSLFFLLRFMSLGKAIGLWLENINLPPPAILVMNPDGQIV